ncbi:MAG TPA: phosphatase PAP2 family protein [Candidatus Saccharimonadales bacterium]|nr:phosphatase PAP2 family protein [Candidatus Saccharimonadales bacterium]
MLKESIVRFDTAITTSVHQWPGWLYGPMWLATTLGHPASMLLLSLGIGWYAWEHGYKAVTYSFAAATAAMLLNTLLKHYIHRPRPDTLYVSNMYFKTASFPSGHAFGAMIVLGLAAYLAVKYMPHPWNIAASILLGLGIFLVGISRVYLGAHYPTDVIAGWVLGAFCLAIIIVFVKP